MAKKQVLQIKDFSGGVNSYSDPRDLQENEFQILDNAAVDERGIIRISGGFELKDNADLPYSAELENITLPKSGTGLFSFIAESKFYGDYLDINTYFEQEANSTSSSQGVTENDGNGAWRFSQDSTNTNDTDISEFAPLGSLSGWGSDGNPSSAAINYFTYSAAQNTNNSHGSLSFKQLDLKPGREYEVYLKCANENPWYFLGANTLPRIRVYNESLGKYYYPGLGFTDTSDATHSALLNNNLSSFIDSPTVGDNPDALTWSSASKGDGSWTASDNNCVLERVRMTSFTDNTCDINANTTVDCDANSNIKVGQHVTGTGIPDDTFIVTVNASSVTQFTISNAATADTDNVTLTFYTPYNHKNFNAMFGGTSTSGDASNGWLMKITSSASGNWETTGNFVKSSEIAVTANTTYVYDAFFHGCGPTPQVGAVQVGMKIYDETNNADIEGSQLEASSTARWKHINELQDALGIYYPSPMEFTTPNNCTSIRIYVGVTNDGSSAAEFAYFSGFNIRKKVNELIYLENKSGEFMGATGQEGHLNYSPGVNIFAHPSSWQQDGEVNDNDVSGSTKDYSYYVPSVFSDTYRRYRFSFTIPGTLEESNEWVLSLDAGNWGGVNQTGVNNFIAIKMSIAHTESDLEAGVSDPNIMGTTYIVDEGEVNNLIVTSYEDKQGENSTYMNMYKVRDEIYKMYSLAFPVINNRTYFNFFTNKEKVFFCDSNFYDSSLYFLKQKTLEETSVEKVDFTGPKINIFTTSASIGGIDYNYSYNGFLDYVGQETTPTYNTGRLNILSTFFPSTESGSSVFNQYSGNQINLNHDVSQATGSGLYSGAKGFKYLSSGFLDNGNPYTKYITIRDNDIANGSGETSVDKLAYNARLGVVQIKISHKILLGAASSTSNYIPKMKVYLDVVSATASDTNKYALPSDTSNFINQIGCVELNPDNHSLMTYNIENDIPYQPSNPSNGWQHIQGWSSEDTTSDHRNYRRIARNSYHCDKTYTLSFNVDFTESAAGSNLLSQSTNYQLRFVPEIQPLSAYWYMGPRPYYMKEWTSTAGSDGLIRQYYLYPFFGIGEEYYDIQSIDFYAYASAQTSETDGTLSLVSSDDIQANISFAEPIDGEADGWDDTFNLHLTSVNEDGVESAIGETSAKNFTNSDVTKCPRIDIAMFFSNPIHSKSKFIKGYMTSKRNSSYNLQFVIDCNKRTIKSSSSSIEYSYTATNDIIQYSLPTKALLIPNEIDSYESQTGVLIENALNPKNMTAVYKTAVVGNNTLYAGNIFQNDIHYPDRMLKSPIGKIPLLPSTNFIDVAISDGDEITSLQFYKDKVLQFKKEKLFIINVSEDYEYLEDTIENVGISQESQITKTPYGIAWINERGCYLYDGQKVNSLTDGKLSYKKWKDSESSWEIDEKYGPIIHYLKKDDKLIVYGATDSLENIGKNEGKSGGLAQQVLIGQYTSKQYLRKMGYQYDFKSKSWVSLTNFSESTGISNYDILDTSLNGKLRVPTSSQMVTNFVYDEKGNSMLLLQPMNSLLNWNDNPKQTMGYVDKDTIRTPTEDKENLHRDFRIITKDYDFGAPSVNKKIYKVYVTFKSTNLESNKDRKLGQNQDLYHPSNVGVYYAINGTNTWTEFSETKSKNYGTKGLISDDCKTTTTLSSNVSILDTTISVASASNIKVGYVLKIFGVGYTGEGVDSESREQMLVTSISGTTIGVRRNYNSTSPDLIDGNLNSHLSNMQVRISTGNWIVAELKPPSSINKIDSFKLRFSTKKVEDATNDENGVPPGFMINDISVIYRTKNVK